MRRFAVFGAGYNTSIPTIYVYAWNKEEALEMAKARLAGKTTVERIEEEWSGLRIPA